MTEIPRRGVDSADVKVDRVVRPGASYIEGDNIMGGFAVIVNMQCIKRSHFFPPFYSRSWRISFGNSILQGFIS